LTEAIASVGVVAAGHPATARAAAEVLAEGGNAFDAALAALAAACVAEPVLASLGGGGFLLARPAGGEAVLYDFFVAAPRRPKPPGDIDFRAVHADFGPARQEFHIGLGSVATPGVVAGMFAVHDDLGRLPMARIVAPAVVFARDGLPVDPVQADILQIVTAIFTASPESLALYGSRRGPGLVRAGERLSLPELAATLAALAAAGPDLFYRGEIGARLVTENRMHGGHLEAEDLAEYRVVRRAPLGRRYRGHRILTNPPPSLGGILIAFALALIEAAGGDAEPLALARVIAATEQARIEAGLGVRPAEEAAAAMLDPALLALYAERLAGRAEAPRGTTHISVIDGAGNAASLSLSNGEGSAVIVPGTGVMLNNMLGEDDVNPAGFHRWPPGERLASMMAPSLIEAADGRLIALGSGGSKRIRSAILQVVVNLLDKGMAPAEAVAASRLHVEGGHLDLEPGFPPADRAALIAAFPDHRLWPRPSMYFGGVQVAAVGTGGPAGGGDSRRGGVVEIV